MSSPASTATEPALVTLHEAEKRYGGRTVLRVDRFALRRGDSLLITGPNGSGKSTLMRLLAGVSTLSSGRVQRSAGYDALKIGYLPQTGGLQPALTVADNFRLWQHLLGSDEPPDLATQWYVQGFDLQPFLHTRGGDLSGGFRRLAALACALSAQPDGLFIDEPLAGVDGAHAQVLVQGLAAAMGALQFLALTSHAAADFAPATRVLDLSPERGR